MQHLTLMDRSHIERTIQRLAIQVWEQMSDADEIVIIGLNDRGFACAQALVKAMEKYDHPNLQLHQFYVKDKGQNSPIPNCTEKFVLLVDDVIFSAKTMFNALSTICYSNEPKKVQVLTLVDRGHRMYPVLSELNGIEVPTKFGEHIEVILNKGILEQVVLFKNN